MADIHNLSAMQLDVLREASNIGVAHAATSLSTLLDQPIHMQVPSVSIVPFADVLEWLDGPDTPVVSTLSHLYGDVSGSVYFMLAINEAEILVRYTSNEPYVQLFDQNQANQLGASVFTEIGHILTGSYVTAIADFTSLSCQPSVPSLQIDMAGAILSHAMMNISPSSDYALIVDTAISYSGQQKPVKSQFLFFPDPQALTNLFTSLGIDAYA